MKTKKEQIAFIKKVLGEIKDTTLSSKCGKYYALVDNGLDVVALSFAGLYGYKTTKIEALSAEVINTIYEDLLVDFNED